MTHSIPDLDQFEEKASKVFDTIPKEGVFNFGKLHFLGMGIEEIEKIDFTKQDVVLAEELNTSRERVRQIRRLLKKPDSISKWKNRRKADFYNRFGALTTEELSSKTIEELQEMFPEVRGTTLLSKLKALGINKRKPKKSTWVLNQNANFFLPDSLLGLLWGNGYRYFAFTRPNKKIKPKFDCRSGHSCRPFNQTLIRLVEEEKRKIRNLFPDQDFSERFSKVDKKIEVWRSFDLKKKKKKT
jgi:hypothetical protein